MKKMVCSLFLAFSSFLSTIQAEIPEPYRSINDLPFDPQGWFGNEEQLKELFNEKEIHTVIEIGSWLGSSTRFLAKSVCQNGKVYAIDTWSGSTAEEIHMQDPRLPFLYQLFLSNVKHENLTDQIIPIRMKSEEAATALKIKADLIYIDASHETEDVYRDILAWNEHLNEGGIMCGDDWLWPTVREAVEQTAKVLNKSIETSHNFWRFR